MISSADKNVPVCATTSLLDRLTVAEGHGELSADYPSAYNYVRQTAEGTVDQFLTEELNNFVRNRRRLPQTFGEFASTQLHTVPHPPAGKKWVIDAITVQVKAAPEPTGELEDRIKRDLEWLFNASSPLALSGDSDLRRKYPRTASSVLNYGLRGVLGRVVHDPAEIQRQVEQALAAFEPRMIVENLSLKLTREGQLIEIEIQGLLLTERARRRLWIRTDLQTLDSKLRTDGNG